MSANDPGHKYTHGAPSGGWPTFGPDGKIVREKPLTAWEKSRGAGLDFDECGQPEHGGFEPCQAPLILRPASVSCVKLPACAKACKWGRA